ncbi:MAG TPA: ABC transporter ATP-binding protein [Dehalococcoidia bacterium]|jgi:Fe-S cluster assembly ATP-binding protein|nr:ABC transporter ATP-binding protein [Dehalococcoidia bacterium]
MLEIKQLSVAIDGMEILQGINLDIGTGETHVLFGPNGSGKTTLLMAIMGFPRYQVTKGSILFKGKDITKLPVDERARLGIGMSFQRPPVVRGVKTRDMLDASMGDRGDKVTIDKLAERANMTELLDREINYGFSGGEIKRSELMQLLAQRPELTLFDEPESGVDLVNIALIGDLINELLDKNCHIRTRKCMGLIITHTGHILDYVNARTGYVMLDGRIGCAGDPHEILATIREKGYEECVKCLAGSVPSA